MQILHSKIYNPDNHNTPLLIFHGLFGMLDNWASFAKEYSQFSAVHCIDLRNHGKSFHHSEMNLEVLSDDIFNYMQEHQIDKANLLGHSLGGKAVMQFAVNHNEKVEKLVVVDIAPKAYPAHHQAIIKALCNVDFNVLTSRKVIEEHLVKLIEDRGVVQFLLKNLYWNEENKLAWRFNLDVLVQNYEQFVGKAIIEGVYSGDTLFLAGEKSNYILQQDAFLIKRQFPNFRLESVSNAGHWVHAENPIEFLNCITKFLQKIGNY